MQLKNDRLNTNSVTTVNGTDDRGAHPKRWIALLVQVRSEKAVGKKLTDLNIENYVPTQWEIHQWSDRKKKVERVVIPMVVFARVDKFEEIQTRNLSLIYKVVTYPGRYEAATIPENQIETLKYMLKHADQTVEMKERILEVGDRIRIARGPLKDLEGELFLVDTDKPMIAVRIECLGYACVSIDKSDVELINA